MAGFVYLLHFDRPYHHARHYVGFTNSLRKRIAIHRSAHAGDGKHHRLMVVIAEAGIGFQVARVWRGTRALERQIKRAGNTPRFCPLCLAEKVALCSNESRRIKGSAPSINS